MWVQQVDTRIRNVRADSFVMDSIRRLDLLGLGGLIEYPITNIL